jgi:hypothetical protein
MRDEGTTSKLTGLLIRLKIDSDAAGFTGAAKRSSCPVVFGIWGAGSLVFIGLAAFFSEW